MTPTDQARAVARRLVEETLAEADGYRSMANGTDRSPTAATNGHRNGSGGGSAATAGTPMTTAQQVAHRIVQQALEASQQTEHRPSSARPGDPAPSAVSAGSGPSAPRPLTEAQASARRIVADVVAAEQAAKEQLAAQREADRLEAERVEAERVEAERVEAERLEAERAAADLARTQQLARDEQADEDGRLTDTQVAPAWLVPETPISPAHVDLMPPALFDPTPDETLEPTPDQTVEQTRDQAVDPPMGRDDTMSLSSDVTQPVHLERHPDPALWSEPAASQLVSPPEPGPPGWLDRRREKRQRKRAAAAWDPNVQPPPQRTGRWLLATILAAVAIAVLFPMAVSALRDLVAL